MFVCLFVYANVQKLTLIHHCFPYSYWSAPVFRIGVIAAAYFAFPLFLRVFYNFQTIDPDDFGKFCYFLLQTIHVLKGNTYLTPNLSCFEYLQLKDTIVGQIAPNGESSFCLCISFMISIYM